MPLDALPEWVGAGAPAVALAAIFVAGGSSPPAALFMGAGAVAMGLALRSLARELGAGAGALRAPEAPDQSIATRLSPFYAFALASVIVFFPDPAGPRALYVLAMAEVPLLAFSTSPRVRMVADLNAGVLVAAANAAGGTGIPLLTALWLALFATGLAFRNLAARADAAGPEERSEAHRAAGLAIGGGAAAFLGAAYLVASALIPAPRPLRLVANPIPAPLRPLQLPWHALAALAGSIVAAVALVYLWHRFFGRFLRGAIARVRGEPDIELSAPAPLPDRPPPPEIPPAFGARAEVVAEYLRFEAALAARDLGRAANEGATEHAGALAVKHPAAAGDLAEIAGRFAQARYGPGDPPPEAAEAVRTKAQQALRKMEG